MNKVAVVLGVAAVATLAGCKDPDYVGRKGRRAQQEVKSIELEPAPAPAPAPVRGCTCPLGTRHTAPCGCGAADCTCIVEAKPVVKGNKGARANNDVIVAQPTAVPVTTAAAAAPAAPEYTTYIVQRNDSLSKISKKYNIRIDSIRKANNLKNDNVRIGQKLKLPGKVDVGEQTVPAGAFTASPKAAAKVGDYTGAVKDYVVKNGDTLGGIAYGNGITIRQLKKLNGLSSDSLKIGQKLKIPAEKVEKAAKAVANVKAPAAPVKGKAEVKSVVKATKAEVAPTVKEAASADEAKVSEPAPAVKDVAPAAPAAEVKAPEAAAPAPVEPATASYTVAEGDDMTSVSIAFGVSAAAIRELNNLSDTDQLKVGQVIKLPADAQQ